MARVLAYASPARGHVFPVTPILDELRRRGHVVALRTLASQVELMGRRGFDAAPIDAAIEAIEHDDHRAHTPLAAQKRALRTFCRCASHEVGDLRRAIHETDPDGLLIDINAWAHSRLPRPGAARGRRGVRTRSRCHRVTRRPSAPA